mmetsp:Transcript_3634/g.4355  ORF Transcript_3634/g.4355 Transcript_3634/m.4355 type:complete len:278 (+) Transcript_3634:154-987(+)
MGLSNSKEPPSDCCPPGAEPLSGTAESLGVTEPLRGEVIKLDGRVRVYLTKPADEVKTPIRGVIIGVHDIFGFATSRTHHLFDELANDGYFVVAPCFFGEKLAHIDSYFYPFTNARRSIGRARYPWKKVKDKLDLVLDYIRSETPYGDFKIGMLGFCWGGWAIFHAAASEEISAGASFHPSLDLCRIHGESIPELCESVKSPQLLMPAFPDPANVRENGLAINTLRKKDFGDKCMVKDFRSRVNHGFANRGNLNNKKVAEAYKEGMDLVRDFFRSNL